MKTALLGGSFDPVHLGHLFLLHCAVTLTCYMRFVIMPAKQSNFKQAAAPGASDMHRLRMLELALEDYREIYPSDGWYDAGHGAVRGKEILISDLEIRRGGISYTIDTVNALMQEYGTGERIGLVLGDDHIPALGRWYGFEELRDKVEFIFCPRRGKSSGDGKSQIERQLPHGIVYRFLQTGTVFPQNATDIRNNVAGHLDYLSPRVRDYVRKNGLYS